MIDGVKGKEEDCFKNARIYRKYAKLDPRIIRRIILEGEFRHEEDKLFRFAHASSLGIASPETIASVYRNQDVSSYKIRSR